METRTHTGFHFFLTYLCIVLPFLALSMLLSSLMLNQMRTDDQALMYTRLSRVIQGLDTHIGQYYESSVYLAHRAELAPATMQADAVNARRGMLILQSVYVFDPIVDDLLVQYMDDLIYGSNGMARSSVYLSRDMQLSDTAYRTAEALLKSETQGASCLRKSGAAGWVMLYYPILLQSQSARMSVSYCIEFSAFGQLLQSMAGDDDMLLRLSFSDGSQLAFGTIDGSLRPLDLSKLNEQSAGDGWICATQATQKMGIEVELYINEQQLYADVTRMQSVNYLLLTIGMLLSALFSGMLTNRRLTQIKTLEAAVENTDGQAFSAMGEFGNLHGLIQRTMRKNVTMLGDFRMLLRTQTARLLFRGLLKESGETLSLLSKCGIELAEEVYFITAVCAQGGNVEEALGDRLFCSDEAAGRTVYLYLDELPNIDAEHSLRLTRGQRLCTALKAGGASCVLVTMSTPVTQLSTIDYAYLSALSELTRQLEAGKKDAICIADDAPTLQSYALPPQDLAAFSSALGEYNAAKARKTLEKMLRQIDQLSAPTEILQYLRYNVMQSMVVTLSESENPEDAPLLATLNEIDPAGGAEFAATLFELCEAFCAHNAVQGDQCEILAYLQENYRREDVSLDEMASHFNVSREHMSRLFRTKTGMRYIDYITKLRMEAAWEMISTTDQSIADVFHAVGYLDRSSSTKKFKKYFGVSPAEARHANASEPHEAPTDD